MWCWCARHKDQMYNNQQKKKKKVHRESIHEKKNIVWMRVNITKRSVCDQFSKTLCMLFHSFDFNRIDAIEPLFLLLIFFSLLVSVSRWMANVLTNRSALVLLLFYYYFIWIDLNGMICIFNTTREKKTSIVKWKKRDTTRKPCDIATEQPSTDRK